MEVWKIPAAMFCERFQKRGRSFDPSENRFVQYSGRLSSVSRVKCLNNLVPAMMAAETNDWEK
jgi:hypothetical protein